MSDSPTFSFLERLRRDYAGIIELNGLQPTDAEAYVARLTIAAHLINIRTVSEVGGRLGPERQRGLVERVIAAAFQTFGGHDPHPDQFEKAALLLRGITQGHPFQDGNKRTGFLIAWFYLEQVGMHRPISFSPDDVVDLCLAVSAMKLGDDPQRFLVRRVGD